MPHLDCGGTPIYYETHGVGPPLVLLHAISTGSGMWRDQIDHFSRHWTVIVLDARGVARSGSIRGWRRIRDRLADDVARVVTHLKHDQVAVCGVSFGGVIAQHFATRHPGLVSSLVIVDSYSDTRPTTLGKALWLVSVCLGATSNLLPRRTLARVMRSQYARWPGAAAHLSEAVMQLRPLDALKTRLAINLVNYPAALEAGAYPILGVVGTASWPRSLRFMAELRRAVPRTRLVQVIDSNDPTPLCQPEAFNTIVEEFLREAEGGRDRW